MAKKTENKEASAPVADGTDKQPEGFMAKKTSTTTKKPAARSAGPVIYIGPNLPGGTMSAFTVYKNGLPAYVEDLKTETPEIARLIVPIKDLSAARKRLARHGAESNAYQAVMKKFNL